MRLSIKLPLLLASGIFVATAAGGWLAIDAATDALERSALGAASEAATGYGAAIEARLDDAIAMLGVPAQVASPAGDQPGGLGGAAALRTSAAAVVDQTDLFEYLTLVRMDGGVVFEVPEGLQVSEPPVDLAYTAWFRQVAATGAVVVSDLHVSATTQLPVVVVAVPVRDAQGSVVGVLAGALRHDTFTRLAAAGPLGIGYGMVTDSRGLVIAHEGNPSYVTFQTDFSSVPAVAAALAGDAGDGRWLNPIENERKLGAYRPLEPWGWAVVYALPEDQALAPVRDLTARLVATSAALILVLGGLGAAVARQVIRPLGRLEQATKDVAAGDLDAHVMPNRRDEVGQLAARFNDMVASLARADAEVRRNAARLQSVNDELEAFANSVSHDLRAPLRAIDGFSLALIEDLGPTLDGEALDHLERVRAAARRMGLLIEDLLRLSRVGRAEMQRTEVDLSDMVRQVAQEMGERDPERDVRWDVEDGIVVDGDESLLRVLIDNLLDNAWKYTSHNAVARIAVGTLEPGVVHVRDDGVGFDMAYADHLFGAFQRLHSEGDFPGTGIGLATARRIVARHGGWIHAYSRPDEGAVVWFTLDDTLPDRPTAPSLATAVAGRD